jgi:hypothetical protein
MGAGPAAQCTVGQHCKQVVPVLPPVFQLLKHPSQALCLRHGAEDENWQIKLQCPCIQQSSSYHDTDAHLKLCLARLQASALHFVSRPVSALARLTERKRAGGCRDDLIPDHPANLNSTSCCRPPAVLGTTTPSTAHESLVGAGWDTALVTAHCPVGIHELVCYCVACHR